MVTYIFHLLFLLVITNHALAENSGHDGSAKFKEDQKLLNGITGDGFKLAYLNAFIYKNNACFTEFQNYLQKNEI